MEWREAGGLKWLEAELPGARAAFTTRVGGMSSGPFDSLNLGLLTDDDSATVHANRAEMCEALEVDPAGIVSGKQVHGSDVVRQDEPSDRSAWLLGAGGDPQLVDGWATSTEGLAPLVFVADCLPIALSGPDGVAMVHGGWRGLAAGIAERGVREVQAQRCRDRPGHWPVLLRGGGGGTRRVLRSGLRHRRRAHAGPGAGVRAPASQRRRRPRSSVPSLCTSCERELFYSHRRDGGVTGRQAGLVWKWPS